MTNEAPTDDLAAVIDRLAGVLDTENDHLARMDVTAMAVTADLKSGLLLLLERLMADRRRLPPTALEPLDQDLSVRLETLRSATSLNARRLRAARTAVERVMTNLARAVGPRRLPGSASAVVVDRLI